MLLIQHGSCFFLQQFSEPVSNVFFQHSYSGIDSHLLTGAVNSVKKKLCCRICLHNIPIYKIMIVFIQQAAQGSPITTVNKGFLPGIKQTFFPHFFQFIIDSAHHMHIREIVQLKIFTNVKLPLQPFRFYICHKITYLRLA